MGRYLDLLRDPGDNECARYRHRDKSDRSDQSHATVEIAVNTRATGSVSSLLSLWSLSPPASTQSDPPNRDGCKACYGDLPSINLSDSESSPAAWGEAEEERAAIVEFDGNIPRAWAEGFARLDPDRPPGDVPPRRWLRFVDDVGRFLDSPFCAVAASFGWGPHDLFGCDRDRPFARVDRAGLLWLLDGNRLVALTEATAVVEMRTGVRQTYRRKPADPSRVLAWELTP
jgi:hypothetical protein